MKEASDYSRVLRTCCAKIIEKTKREETRMINCNAFFSIPGAQLLTVSGEQTSITHGLGGIKSHGWCSSCYSFAIRWLFRCGEFGRIISTAGQPTTHGYGEPDLHETIAAAGREDMRQPVSNSLPGLPKGIPGYIILGVSSYPDAVDTDAVDPDSFRNGGGVYGGEGGSCRVHCTFTCRTGCSELFFFP